MGRGDRHGRVLECRQQRCDSVRGRNGHGLEHDDDLARRTPQCGLQGVAGAEGHGRGDDLSRVAVDGAVGPGHDQQLGAIGGRLVDGAHDYVGEGVVRSDHDHRGRGSGRRVQASRNRLHRAVERALTVAEVGRTCRLQVVAGTEVDDLPAGGFDALLELIGGAVVALHAGGGPLVGERDDLVGY